MEIFPYGGIKGRVVAFVLDRPTAQVKVTEIAKKIGVSKGHASEVIAGLKREGIVKGGVVDLNDPYVRSLKIALNMSRIVKGGVISVLKKLGAEGAGLYGSWANGTNTEQSDVDIWIKTKDRIPALRTAELSSHISKILETQPQIIFLDEEKIKKLRKNNEVFYFTLLLGSTVLFGENIG